MPPAARSRPDACPGVLDPHSAADGALARVRLPGGVLRPEQAHALAECADRFGDGAVHLTSRGNVQLRGLDADDPRPGRVLAEAGLLPSVAHERARNVLASPLSGVAGGLADVRGLAAELDRGLCARPELADLPGRVLFALDDGRGDVAALQPDFAWLAVGRTVGRLVLGGRPTTQPVARVDAVDALLGAAQKFLRLRAQDGGTAWRVGDLDGGPDRLAAAVGTRTSRDALPPAPVPPAVGPIPHGDGGTAVGLAPVLGELRAEQLRLLAGLTVSTAVAVVTPWRTVLLPEPVPDALERLRAAGLVVDPDDPALRVSACAGTPGCARSRADVRGLARLLLPHGPPPGVRAHLVGCERRCGAPRGSHVEVVAVGHGFLVDGFPVDAAVNPPDLVAALTAAHDVTHDVTHDETGGGAGRGEAGR